MEELLLIISEIVKSKKQNIFVLPNAAISQKKYKIL